MWTGSCSMAVFLFVCAFLVCSDVRATVNGVNSGAFSSAASAVSSASAFSNAFAGTGNFPGIQDGHKEIRSYDSTSFSHDNNANRGAKSNDTPSGHGAGHDRNVKDGGHDYNRNGDDCSKCKWENDDYWERDEPEEEQNEDECDDGDDGQYRPDKTYHHASGSGRKPASRPYQSDVHKGPTVIYSETNAGVKESRPSDTNFPTNIGYAGSNSNFGGTTSKPGISWNAPFTSKPGYSSATAGASGTNPSSWPSWNTRTTPSGFDSTPSFVTTPRPGINWNIGAEGKPGQEWNHGFGNTPTTGFPPQKPTSGWNAHDNKFSGNFGTTPIPGSNWNIGFSTIPTIKPSSQKPGTPWTRHDGESFGTTPRPGQSWNTGFGSKPGLNPWNYGTSSVSQSGCTQSESNCNQGPSSGNIPDYSKPEYGSGPHNIWPSNVATTFGNTKGPYEGINSPVPETQGTTKPSYGTNVIYSWSTPGQIGSGSSSWHGPENTKPYAGSPTSNTRFPTTKAPFNYGSASTLFGSPYGTESKQPNFNIASSSATANAGANVFATSFNTHNIPGIIGATPSYGTTLAHGRGTNYPGNKDFPGNIRPSYGTTYDTYPKIENAWPDKRPDIGSGTSPSRYPENVGSTWPIKQSGTNNEPRGKPEIGSSISKYPGNYDGIWPAGRPRSTSGTTPRYFETGNGNKPTEQSTDGSGTWPDGQSKHGVGSGCSSVTCRDSTDSIGGNSNCGNGNYNCGSNCKEDNYASTRGSCTGSSGVQVYYPTGSGDSNIPNFGITHKPNSASNINTGIYPGTGCGNGNSCNQGGNVIPEEPIKWNPANPFLYGTGGSTPSDVSRPWDSEFTVKPLGKGNPFLDSNWSTPKPVYNSNDKNVIPLGGQTNKPIGQRNPFLDNSKKRGDINANDGVISLDNRKPEGNNPFIRPESGSNGPSYGHPIESGISNNYGGDSSHSGGISPQGENNTGLYLTGGNPQHPLQCNLGIFGCGTPGSGSYASTKSSKHPTGSYGGIGGNVGTGTGIRPNPVPDHFGNSASHPGSPGNNVASIGGAYAGSFSSAQASSYASATSLSSSDAAGIGNNLGQAYGGSWSSSGAQNLGKPNPWASSGASAFASSSSGSWSGNRPTDVKG